MRKLCGREHPRTDFSKLLRRRRLLEAGATASPAALRAAVAGRHAPSAAVLIDELAGAAVALIDEGSKFATALRVLPEFQKF